MTDEIRLIEGDCLEILPTLDAGSIDLILTDPPYFKVKGDAWDHQWAKPAAFLEWMGRLCVEWRRVLAPNGSLYVFASPRMAARVECVIGEHFAVINRITWRKPAFSTKAEMFRKGDLRSFFPASEAIVFAEQFGADSMAMGESGWAAKCDEARGFVFEPLRSYLDGQRALAGLSVREVAEAFQRKTGSRTVTGMAGHWFGRGQWELPTAANYAWLRELLNPTPPVEYLRREYDDLRREYDDLRRPFTVSAEVPYTDVWDFPTVSSRPGKHPCEKPSEMMRHVINASSRPGDTVLDCFMGSGVVGEAARDLGRKFVGIEQDPGWFGHASARIAGGMVPTRPKRPGRKPTPRGKHGAGRPMLFAFAEQDDHPEARI